MCSPVAQSVANFGTVTAPASGAAIVTIAAGSLPQGRYFVRVVYGYGATAGLVNGMELRKGAATFCRLTIPNVASTAAAHPYECVIDLDGSTALSVNAVGAGGAGSIYMATITATRVEQL